MEELINRIEKTRFDVYLTTVGFLLVVGGIYIYLNYYLNQDPRDSLTGIFTGMAMWVGFSLVGGGLVEFNDNYSKEKHLSDLEYEKRKLELTFEIKKLKKKYGLKDEPTFWEKFKKKFKKKQN